MRRIFFITLREDNNRSFIYYSIYEGISMSVSPETQQGSKFTVYLGIVLEDKDPYSRDIKVHLQEILPFLTGDVTPIVDKKQVSGGDSGYTGKVETTNTIEAKYFGVHTNRRYPPDIRKNEQVLVLNYADSDTYYWLSLGRDDNLRKLERVNLSASDHPKPGDDLTDENTYYIELDTLFEKRIIIKTSNTDGEKYRYTLIFDAKKNQIILCDDADNEIIIESDIPRVRMRNRDGTVLDLAKKNMSLIVPEDYLLKVGRQAVFDIPALSIKNTGGSGATEWDVTDLHMNSKKSVVLKAPAIELDGAVHAKTVVSGPMQSTGYSTGSDGGPYTGVSINKENGSGSAPSNSPNVGGGGGNNRHAAAWEQVAPALKLLAQCIEQLGGCSDVSTIIALADDSLMPLNRGE